MPVNACRLNSTLWGTCSIERNDICLQRITLSSRAVVVSGARGSLETRTIRAAYEAEPAVLLNDALFQLSSFLECRVTVRMSSP
jgi:hypothetical protein